MRPRHFAEEILADLPGGGLVRGASMRPRHFAEEIVQRARPRKKSVRASMRPRHFAEEIWRPVAGSSWRRRCFNEASAFRRGNRASSAHVVETSDRASMRPRHFAEEIAQATDHGAAKAQASMRPRHFAEEILAGRTPRP